MRDLARAAPDFLHRAPIVISSALALAMGFDPLGALVKTGPAIVPMVVAPAIPEDR